MSAATALESIAQLVEPREPVRRSRRAVVWPRLVAAAVALLAGYRRLVDWLWLAVVVAVLAGGVAALGGAVYFWPTPAVVVAAIVVAYGIGRVHERRRREGIETERDITGEHLAVALDANEQLLDEHERGVDVVRHLRREHVAALAMVPRWLKRKRLP